MTPVVIAQREVSDIDNECLARCARLLPLLVALVLPACGDGSEGSRPGGLSGVATTAGGGTGLPGQSGAGNQAADSIEGTWIENTPTTGCYEISFFERGALVHMRICPGQRHGLSIPVRELTAGTYVKSGDTLTITFKASTCPLPKDTRIQIRYQTSDEQLIVYGTGNSTTFFSRGQLPSGQVVDGCGVEGTFEPRKFQPL